LRTVDGEIVAGPSELAATAYVSTAAVATDTEVTALVERLASDPRVRFAGRAFTESAR